MDIKNTPNKYIFGIGIFLCLTYGVSLVKGEMETVPVLGFLLGAYNVWNHGFVKDASSWDIKPIYFVLAVAFILFGMSNI